jgi:hypothetical protein
MIGAGRFGFIAMALAAAMLLTAGCGKENDVTGFSSKGLVKGTVTTGGAAVGGAQVYIDGALAGTTATDGSIVLDLAPGEHTVYLIVGGVTTSAVTIQIADGDYLATFDVTRNPDRTLGLTVTLTPVPVEEKEATGCAAASLGELRAAVDALDPAAFSGKNSKRTYLKKLDVVLANSERGNCKGALQKLTNDVAAKADGCAAGGAPDANDWIVDCAAQETLAIEELTTSAAVNPEEEETEE